VSLIADLAEATAHVRSKTDVKPAIGLVLGSGLGAFAQTLERAVRIPFGEIPHFPVSTVQGHKGELVLGQSNGVPVAVMTGRVHHYEGYSQQQVVFPVRVLSRLGVKLLILTNAAGSININFKPGELMIIEDHINLTGSNPLIGPNEDQLGPRFFDMTVAYDPQMREIAEKACWKVGVQCRKGVYIGVTGPSYETPAEIKMARTMGADAVGMSTVPETIAARHLGLRVLGLSCMTNMAAGVSKGKLDHGVVLAVAERVKSALLDVLARIIQECAKLA
jgi:purine-nucleoside phosphorylase